ncbi:type VI secretion system baseplate subunit TssF [Variovorax ginsengisoli]|uniref:Type VI secretion system protein ImpG n=1 Tax=Variovorax ginsengisoli TaxID=363844 RepID=A0ABT9SAU9_9BURK|nr:type VI secretion system baseplate subunit TssF [Variovorax ginsengisoli]MDP9901039.1 type VI secretion system protein ImpG [Variovorax ginsengisoli]
MDPRLLRYYNQELRYLRELGGEFAQEFPKIAARLGMEGLEVTDPYIERLLEGCAFLAARVQLKQDAEFPRFSHRLLELIYPNFLAPVPAMLVAQITPVPDPNLLTGPVLARETPLIGPASAASKNRCEFRTGQPVQLSPLTTVSAEYFLNMSELNIAGLHLPRRPRAGVRIQLQLPAGMALAQLQPDTLRFYLAGQTETAMQLHELIFGAAVGVLIGPPGRAGDGRRTLLPASALQAVGYTDEEAMLPPTLRGFAGTRLLQEYFAFPERFLFVDLEGVQRAIQAIAGQVVEITLLFAQPGIGLEGAVSAGNFCLNCVPAINLFPKRADRIQVTEGNCEFHVVPERTAPLDYEVYDVVGMQGYTADGTERRFLPLYAPDHRRSAQQQQQPAFYTIWREPRLPSEAARRDGPRSGYTGCEVFVSLVDPNDAPYAETLQQVAVQTRCTNRDLPVFMPSTGAQAEFKLDAGVPTQSVRVMAGPSRPHTALREGGVAWRLLNLLSLNYLSLLDTDGGEAAAALRDLLSRFPQGTDPAVRRQIEALQNVSTRAVVRRHPIAGPIAFGRGIEVTLTVDELGYTGGSAFLFGSAMHHYLSRHASLNSFVETVLVSLTRGEVMRWKPSRGTRAVL